MANKNEVMTLRVTDKQAVLIEQQAEAIVIKDAGTMETAAEFLSRANSVLDEVVAYKESKTKPLNEALKIIRAETKPFESILQNAIENIRSKMGKYLTEMITKKKAQEEKIGLDIASGKIKIETGLKKMDAVKDVEKSIETQSGGVSFMTQKKLKIVNLLAIPREFLIVDEKHCLDALKKGEKVPGCEMEMVQIPVNSR
jgi:hypothetical protein